MVVGIELARAMEPLTFFQMKVFNAQLAIRYKSTTQLNTHPHCEKSNTALALSLFSSSLTGLGCSLPGLLLPLETSPIQILALADPPRPSPSLAPEEQTLIGALQCPSFYSRCGGIDRPQPPRPCPPRFLIRL
jgi:hypothetical protein